MFYEEEEALKDKQVFWWVTMSVNTHAFVNERTPQPLCCSFIHPLSI